RSYMATKRTPYTPVAAHRLSMKYERHAISQRFLANLTMRNKTRVLSFTVTQANIDILPRPFSARPSSASVSHLLKVVDTFDLKMIGQCIYKHAIMFSILPPPNAASRVDDKA